LLGEVNGNEKVNQLSDADVRQVAKIEGEKK
jgi:hypothetical protein